MTNQAAKYLSAGVMTYLLVAVINSVHSSKKMELSGRVTRDEVKNITTWCRIMVQTLTLHKQIVINILLSSLTLVHFRIPNEAV